MNINILNDGAMGGRLMMTLQSTGFVNLINTPTRVTQTTSSCLDLLITNADMPVSHCGTITSDISDHCPVYMVYHSKNQSRNSQRKPFLTQHVSAKTLESFKSDIMVYNWSALFEITDPNLAYSSFLAAFVKMYKTHFPFKPVSRNKKTRKPWITAEHVKKINEKNKLYHLFLRTRSVDTLEAFKKARNKLNNQLRQAKAAYHQQLFEDIFSKHPDVVWKLINDSLGRGKINRPIETIVQNGHELSGKSLADYFNRCFTNIDAPCGETAALQIPISGPTGSVFLEPTDDFEVYRTFMNIKNSKSLDIDSIQIKPIKYVLEFITPILTHIYNLILQTAVFPDKMKRAKVTVVFKQGDRNDPKNYRPISVIPVFSKCLEKLIFSRMSRYLEAKSIITDAQFGFRKGRSTETALLTIKEHILSNMEKNNFTLALFIDFSKAFDCLNHDILAEKICQWGIRGKPLALMKSYLENRMQSVHISGQQSTFLPILNGVPQGSVLGPLLFNLYINDIAH